MFSRLASPFKEFGIFPGLIYSLDRILQRCSPNAGILFHDWMVQPITSESILPQRYQARYQTREITGDDALIREMPVRPEILRSRLAQKAVCLGTFKNETLLGYVWFSFDTYKEDEARCTFVLKPADQSVFDFDLYIYPKYRMGLAFAALWDGASRYLYDAGIRHSYSRVTRFNIQSSSAHDHLGWKRVGSAVILKLWRSEFVLTTIAPRISILFSPAKRVRIELVPDALKTSVPPGERAK